MGFGGNSDYPPVADKYCVTASPSCVAKKMAMTIARLTKRSRTCAPPVYWVIAEKQGRFFYLPPIPLVCHFKTRYFFFLTNGIFYFCAS